MFDGEEKRRKPISRKCSLYPAHIALMDSLKKALLPFVPPPLQRLKLSSFSLLLDAVRVLLTQLTSIARQHVSRWHLLFCALWAAGFWLAAWAEFGLVFVILSGFAFVFGNTAQGGAGAAGVGPDGTPFRSAYSVFNEGCRAMMGTATAEQFDEQLRHRPAGDDAGNNNNTNNAGGNRGRGGFGAGGAEEEEDAPVAGGDEEDDLREAMRRSEEGAEALARKGGAGNKKSRRKEEKRRAQGKR